MKFSFSQENKLVLSLARIFTCYQRELLFMSSLSTVMESKGKHLLNSLETAVTENLIGYALQNQQLQVIPSLNSIVSKAALNASTACKTAILSGAGSGHEPFAHGLVGRGGIGASIAGQVFASPSTGQVVKVLRILSKYSKEILIVVNNYTGDRLNFGLAAERVKLDGISCKLLCFGDDVSFDSEKIKKTGRRGLAGGTLLLKCLGFLSEQGLNLEDLYHQAVNLTAKIATMSVSLTACDIPGSGTSFTLNDNQMELGLGIHGESGVARTDKLLSSRAVVSVMIDHIMNPAKSPIASLLKEKTKIALLINNIGGLSNFDLNVVAKDAVEESQSRGFIVERLAVGTFVSSFSMNGVSISIMIVDDEIIKMLDASSECPGFAKNPFQPVNSNAFCQTPEAAVTNNSEVNSHWVPIPGLTPDLFRKLLLAACQSLIQVEGLLNQLDKQGGDGDCGLTCKKGAEAIIARVNSSTNSPTFLDLSEISSLEMGGTSGAIYSLLMTSIHSSAVEYESSTGKDKSLHDIISFWSSSLDKAIETVTLYSWASSGDRTMLDTLFYVSTLLKRLSSDSSAVDNHTQESIWKMIVEAASSGAEATARMKSKAGRSLYANESITEGNPDPGAVGVKTWITAISSFFTS